MIPMEPGFWYNLTNVYHSTPGPKDEKDNQKLVKHYKDPSSSHCSFLAEIVENPPEFFDRSFIRCS